MRERSCAGLPGPELPVCSTHSHIRGHAARSHASVGSRQSTAHRGKPDRQRHGSWGCSTRPRSHGSRTRIPLPQATRSNAGSTSLRTPHQTSASPCQRPDPPRRAARLPAAVFWRTSRCPCRTPAPRRLGLPQHQGRTVPSPEKGRPWHRRGYHTASWGGHTKGILRIRCPPLPVKSRPGQNLRLTTDDLASRGLLAEDF